MWSPVSVCALCKVRLQLANIAIKIQYTWLVSTVHSSSLHRFPAESGQQDNILGLSSTTILLNGSAHNHLWLYLDKFSSDCFYSYCFFIPCLFRQNSCYLRGQNDNFIPGSSRIWLLVFLILCSSPRKEVLGNIFCFL